MILHYYYSTSNKKNQVIFRYLAIFKNPLLPDRDRSAGSCIGYGIRQERGDSDEALTPCDRRHARRANLFAVGMRHARGGSALRMERTSARTPRLAACADDPLCFGCCGRYRADHECMICRIYVFTFVLSCCFVSCIRSAKPLPFTQQERLHSVYALIFNPSETPLKDVSAAWMRLQNGHLYRRCPSPRALNTLGEFRTLRSAA